MLAYRRKEADTRVIVRLLHALKTEKNKIEVRIVDMDIVVLLIRKLFYIQAVYPQVDI